MFKKTHDPNAGRRKYIRLDTVFPVEFQLVEPQTKQALTPWLQGFSRNVSKGGLCLEINSPDKNILGLVKSGENTISLRLELPASGKKVFALAHIAWQQDKPEQTKLLFGLSYDWIQPQDNRLIMRWARMKKNTPALIGGLVFILAFFLIAVSLANSRLNQENKINFQQLQELTSEAVSARQKIKDIDILSRMFKERIEGFQAKINQLEQENKKILSQPKQAASEQIEKLKAEKSALREKLIALTRTRASSVEELMLLAKRKADLSRMDLGKMQQWLASHQNRRTGLVMSFEGDNSIAGWAFIYDQSLAGQAYLLGKEYAKAKKILEFFSKTAERGEGGLFFNAYYAREGDPVEYVVHSGPNIWLGMLALQYIAKTGDPAYVVLAEEIAEAIIRLQNQDKEYGIRGGPAVSWYSTEHNLDAFAFFGMLYQLTARAEYKEAQERVLDWLATHAYDRQDVPIARGKGDSTIATDTYAWSIAALGPEQLEKIKMDPDEIMDFAVKNCTVEVGFKKNNGQRVSVKGFDFAAARHVSRGGVVSPEWTAQMVIALKIMSAYHRKKGDLEMAKEYQDKAEGYLANLGKMIITSPSASGQGAYCLPYATQESADTGHGWLTPKGEYTGSVAGTAYALFAFYDYNPLELNQ